MNNIKKNQKFYYYLIFIKKNIIKIIINNEKYLCKLKHIWKNKIF